MHDTAVRDIVGLRYSNDPLQERMRTSLAGILQSQLKNVLPEYLLPDRVVVLGSLPRTANGKLERAALPRIDNHRISRADDYVAPRNATELGLVALWEEALLLAPVGVNDDFLALGGNSLTALRLVARMRARFGHDIDLSTLFSGLTIADIATDLQAASATKGSLLVPLAGASSEQPVLYCFHAIGGSVLSYVPLAQLIQHSGGVVGVQSQGLYGTPSDCIHSMADAYAATIIADGDLRPCSMLGWSFGGLLAIEVAARLCAAGKAVELVSLIDTDLGWSDRSRVVLQKGIVTYLEQELGCDVVDINHFEPLNPVQLANLIASSPKYCHVVDAKDAYRVAATVTSNLDALSNYRPSTRYHGRVTYFRAMEESHKRDVEAHWPKLLEREPEVIDIAAEHFSIMQAPHVTTLAKHLRSELSLSLVLGAQNGVGNAHAESANDVGLSLGQAERNVT